MLVGEFISDVSNSVKALTKDDRISPRYIHSLAKHYTSYLLSQRKLSDVFRESSIFSDIPCVEMIPIRSDKCDIAEFRKCDKLMRSKCKLPAIFSSSIGQVIISVMNINGSTEYQRLRTPADYSQQRKRRFQKATKYYYINNDYIYIVGSTPERITINALFEDQREAESFSSCADPKDKCKSVYDYKIVIPGKYISTVKDQTIEHILKTRRQIVEDDDPNLATNDKQ